MYSQKKEKPRFGKGFGKNFGVKTPIRFDNLTVTDIRLP
jgi:hypothetical protein